MSDTLNLNPSDNSLQSQQPGQRKIAKFEFHGQAGEYFKIWIVNIMLTIVTLGIYSAWAKVRNNRYIYGNTYLDNAAFDYIANPVAILKGRLIAFAVLVVYAIVTEVIPVLAPLFGFAFLIAMPWLVVKSMQFSLRNTTYRNIRFNFIGRYGEAVRIFVGMTLLMPLTLGLIYPYFVKRRTEFMIKNSRYGKTQFNFDASGESFYKIYIIGFLMLMGVGGLYFMLIMTLFPGIQSMEPGDEPPMIINLLSFAFIPFYFLIWAYIDTQVKNITWKHVFSGDNRFDSQLRTGMIFWITLTNMLLIIISLGLLIPWAKIRMTRYRLGCMHLAVSGDLNQLVGESLPEVSAAGEGVSDVFDVDLGL